MRPCHQIFLPLHGKIEVSFQIDSFLIFEKESKVQDVSHNQFLINVPLKRTLSMTKTTYSTDNQNLFIIEWE